MRSVLPWRRGSSSPRQPIQSQLVMHRAPCWHRPEQIPACLGWTADDAYWAQAAGELLAPGLSRILERVLETCPHFACAGMQPDRPEAESPDTSSELPRLMGDWLRGMFDGAYDAGYALTRWQAGTRLAEKGVEDVCVAMFARLRTELVRELDAAAAGYEAQRRGALQAAVHKLIDLNLALLESACEAERAGRAEQQAQARGAGVFRALVDAAPCLIVVTRLDQSVVYFNRFAEKVTGLAANEVLGQHVAHCLPIPELASGMEGPPAEFEAAIKSPSGGERWVLWNRSRLTSYEGQPAWLLVGLDRTELKQIQQRAWQVERLAELGMLAGGLAHEIRNPLNTIRFNLLNIQHLLTAPDMPPAGDRTVSASDPAFSAAAKEPSPAGVGEAGQSGVPSPLAPSRAGQAGHAAAQGSPGTAVPAAVAGIGVATSGPHAAGVQEASAGSSRANLSAELAQMLRDIADEVDRLEGIVRDFLHMARPDPAEISQVDLVALVDSVARLVEPSLAAHRIALDWSPPSGSIAAAADPRQLKQVLLNLIVNAQQAMPNGGVVTLRLHARGGHLVIEVADTGPGIPAELQERIFQPFFSTKREGTGLGLSICRRLVEQMGGTIDVQSPPGKGAVFSVRLPRTPAQEP